MATTFDVGVIGAGVHGSAAAFHLASRGVSVVIVERWSPAAGPTGRSSAVCRSYYTDPFLAACARDSISMLRDFSAHVGTDAGFRTMGLYYLHAPGDVDDVRANVARLIELGIEVHTVEGEELAAALPGFAVDDVGIAAHEARAGYADPHAVTEGLVRRATELGASTRFGRRVVTLEPSGAGGAELGLDDGERLACGRVVLAAGPWTRPLAAQAGVDLPLTVERHVVATFRWGGAAPIPALGDVVSGYYLRPEGEELFLAGPLTPEPTVDPDDFDPEIRAGEVEGLAASITHRVPRLSVAQHHGGWASLYDVSPDWMPVIGEIAPGIVVDAGTSGHGFKLAPALGAHVADLALGEPTDPLLVAFSPARFASGSTLAAGYGAARILG